MALISYSKNVASALVPRDFVITCSQSIHSSHRHLYVPVLKFKEMVVVHASLIRRLPVSSSCYLVVILIQTGCG